MFAVTGRASTPAWPHEISWHERVMSRNANIELCGGKVKAMRGLGAEDMTDWHQNVRFWPVWEGSLHLWHEDCWLSSSHEYLWLNIQILPADTMEVDFRKCSGFRCVIYTDILSPLVTVFHQVSHQILPFVPFHTVKLTPKHNRFVMLSLMLKYMSTNNSEHKDKLCALYPWHLTNVLNTFPSLWNICKADFWIIWNLHCLLTVFPFCRHWLCSSYCQHLWFSGIAFSC